MSRYLVTRKVDSIARVDRETAYYYVCVVSDGRGGTYDNRWKKQHGDVLFDTFDEAAAVLREVADRRVSEAWLLDEKDLEGKTWASITSWNDLEEAMNL